VENTNAINRNTEALLEAYREVGLEVNTKEINYMAMFHKNTKKKNHYFLTANRSFENMATFQVIGNNSHKSKFHS
jgi:hypothetical protein